MQYGQTIYSRRRRPRPEYRDWAIKACYTVIFVVLATFVIRPLMVKEILDRAEAYLALGFHDESRRQCDKALLIDAENSRAWYVLGNISKAEGDRDLACASYLKATEADHTNRTAQLEVGMMFVKDGRYEQAIPHFEQIKAQGLDKPLDVIKNGFSFHRTALDMLVLCYQKAGDPDKAKHTEEEARVFYPNYGRMEEHLAQSKTP
jgi:tetratricopeptide (TPR) repeat protein